MKIGLITELDHVFTGRIIFKFLDYKICKIPPLHSSLPPSMAWHIWILYGLNPSAFVSLFNDVLDILGRLSNGSGWLRTRALTRSLLSLVTTVDFRFETSFLAYQKLLLNSNLAINL